MSSVQSTVPLSRSARPRTSRDLAVLALWVFGAIYASVAAAGWHRLLGFDAHAYWLAWHHRPLYGASPNAEDAYLYSPAFAQALWPLAQLPWPFFLAFWSGCGLALYAWLLRPLGARVGLPLLLFCIPQAMVGNIWPLLAIVLVLGFARPELWAFALLTKVTAGVGLVWFAVRRDWSSLVRAGVSTALVAGVSAAISPGLWRDWLHLLSGGGAGGTPAGAYDIPLAYRLPVALALAVYAAMRTRPGYLAVAMSLACPVFALSFVMSNLTLLLALPRLRTQPAATSRRAASPTTPGRAGRSRSAPAPRTS
jgi:hypothetical protein